LKAALWIAFFWVAGCTIIMVENSTDTEIGVMTDIDAPKVHVD